MIRYNSEVTKRAAALRDSDSCKVVENPSQLTSFLTPQTRTSNDIRWTRVPATKSTNFLTRNNFQEISSRLPSSRPQQNSKNLIQQMSMCASET